MLERIDRVQMAVPDRAAAAVGWVDLLGAEHERDDRLATLGALRSTYRLGSGRVELLEPDGAGPVADAVGRWGGHLFAVGAATPDIDPLAARLRSRGVDPHIEAGQMHLSETDTGGHGLRLVVSPSEELAEVGTVEHLYEVTNLARDAPAVAEHYADLFGLSAASFEPIDSRHYGYAGTLTLFDPDHLDRLEVITPDEPTKTIGRFFAKRGPSLYMAFAECSRLAAVEDRLRDRGLGFTAEPSPDQRDRFGAHTLFIHPSALGGMMLGLSRTTFAWLWSGHPERVEGGQ